MADIKDYPKHSGDIIGPDSKVHNIVTLLQNIGGGASMDFLFGAAAPAANDGKSGDVYLNTGNGDLYKKSEAWAKIGNLKGPAGAKGDTGTTGAKGATGPAGKDGAPTQEEWDALVTRVTALEEK